MAKAFNIRNIYKTDREFDDLIRKVENDLYDSELYNTPDSRRKVLRLKKFLSELKGMK